MSRVCHGSSPVQHRMICRRCRRIRQRCSQTMQSQGMHCDGERFFVAHHCIRVQRDEVGSCSFFWNAGMLAAMVAKWSSSVWFVAFYNISFFLRNNWLVVIRIQSYNLIMFLTRLLRFFIFVFLILKQTLKCRSGVYRTSSHILQVLSFLLVDCWINVCLRPPHSWILQLSWLPGCWQLGGPASPLQPSSPGLSAQTRS